MKTINLKWICCFIILTVLTVMIFYWKGALTLSFFFEVISKSLSILTILGILFEKYLWKLPIFKNWLVYIPNLNGIWEGNILSDWVDPKTGKACLPIKTSLTIKQSLLHISCVMKTGEMKSRSLSSGFNIDQANQVLELSYVYISVPHQNIQGRSPMHYGAIIFQVEQEKEIILKGNYWTGRKTSGAIDLKKSF